MMPTTTMTAAANSTAIMSGVTGGNPRFSAGN